MPFNLPSLPYEKHALEPHISSETLDYHHDKHHAAYVNKLNDLIRNTSYKDMSLTDIVNHSSGAIFNNSAQAWNHEFYWQCLSPKQMEPKGELLRLINRDFGSVKQFLLDFHNEATSLFGSGWVWLTRSENGDQLKIEKTSNAENPMVSGRVPLLTVDVWEHAYYIDYRNERSKYIEAIPSLLNWDFAAKNLANPKLVAA